MILEGVISYVIERQRETFPGRDKGLTREMVPGTKSLSSHALIISGIRRCGKSTLLLQMMNSMNMEKVLFLNFDTPQLYGFSMNDFLRLDRIIADKGADTLLFDEIQLVEGWEIYVRQKLDEGFKVVATGSNASMLSTELGTRLTGRHITQELFPFSFSEFLSFRILAASKDSIGLYIEEGGFPEFLKSRDEEQLKTLFNDILLRDIVARHGVKDSGSLLRLTNYLLANSGNRVTATKLLQPMSVGSASTILNWFSFLEATYLFSFVPAFSYSLKAQLINPRKVYAIDTGMLSALSVSKTDDRGRMLENLVYLHLRRKFTEIYYFDDHGECDFVVFNRNNAPELIQVCLELNPDNLNREVKGILAAMKFFDVSRAVIVTLSDSDQIVEDKFVIDVVPVYQYLLG